MAPSTIAKIHRILHHALTDAVRLGHVMRNVSQFVKLPPVNKRERVTQALTLEQARTLLSAAQDDPLEALYVLALTTGMRQGELLALKWRDLDLTYGKLQIQRTLLRVSGGKTIVSEPKSPTSHRCIHVPQLAIEALHRHAQRRRVTRQRGGRSKQTPEWVFCDDEGSPLRATRLIFFLRPLHILEGLISIAEHPSSGKRTQVQWPPYSSLPIEKAKRRGYSTEVASKEIGRRQWSQLPSLLDYRKT